MLLAPFYQWDNHFYYGTNRPECIAFCTSALTSLSSGLRPSLSRKPQGYHWELEAHGRCKKVVFDLLFFRRSFFTAIARVLDSAFRDLHHRIGRWHYRISLNLFIYSRPQICSPEPTLKTALHDLSCISLWQYWRFYHFLLEYFCYNFLLAYIQSSEDIHRDMRYY